MILMNHGVSQMNELIRKNKITEMQFAQNPGYILSDNSLFSLTDFKVLKNKEQTGGFIKCSRAMFNGRSSLVYFTGENKSLSQILLSIDPETFAAILKNLFEVLLEIKSIGFLSYQNIDISVDKIFINQKTLSVSLIYLPIASNTVGEEDFLNELRTQLIQLISTTPTLSSDKASKISMYLSNASMNIEELYKSISAECTGGRYKSTSRQPLLNLVSVNAKVQCEFTINTNEFVLGRVATKCNAVIPGNPAISSAHCKFIFRNGEYFIQDMKSSNGSFLNSKRLVANELYSVKSGDRLRLANEDFLIRI